MLRCEKQISFFFFHLLVCFSIKLRSLEYLEYIHIKLIILIFISRLSMIVQVNVVLNRTVIDSD